VWSAKLLKLRHRRLIAATAARVGRRRVHHHGYDGRDVRHDWRRLAKRRREWTNNSQKVAMQNLPKYLRYLGLLAGVVAAILAVASMESSATETHRMNPESAIAMAIVAFVFVRASELSPPR
jgi:hypothetical protein